MTGWRGGGHAAWGPPHRVAKGVSCLPAGQTGQSRVTALKPTWGPISFEGLLGARQVTYGTAGLELQAWKQLGAMGPRVRSLAEAHQSGLQGLVL